MQTKRLFRYSISTILPTILLTLLLTVSLSSYTYATDRPESSNESRTKSDKESNKGISKSKEVKIEVNSKEIKVRLNREQRKSIKRIKKEYPLNYAAVVEFSNRQDKLTDEQQLFTTELIRQTEAFLDIAKALESGDEKLRKKIAHGMVRWNWKYGDAIIGNPKPVDYYMVWMEALYKK